MKFLCLIAAEMEMEMMPPEAATRAFEEDALSTRRIRRRGRSQSANRRLLAASDSTLQEQEGKARFTDGPFAETKEQIGG